MTRFLAFVILIGLPLAWGLLTDYFFKKRKRNDRR